MKNYEVILTGFDGSTDDTDHLVKWLRAPSLKAVKLFLGDFPLHSLPTSMNNQGNLGHEDGIDVILDSKGEVVSDDFKLFVDRKAKVDPAWEQLVKQKQLLKGRRSTPARCTVLGIEMKG